MDKTMSSKTENYITLEDAKPPQKIIIINKEIASEMENGMTRNGALTLWRENTRKQR